MHSPRSLLRETNIKCTFRACNLLRVQTCSAFAFSWEQRPSAVLCTHNHNEGMHQGFERDDSGDNLWRRARQFQLFFVGIGNGSFSELERLGAAGSRLAFQGRKAERDIVQFASVNAQTISDVGIEEFKSVFREQALAQLPWQMATWMMKNGVSPNSTKCSSTTMMYHPSTAPTQRRRLQRRSGSIDANSENEDSYSFGFGSDLDPRPSSANTDFDSLLRDSETLSISSCPTAKRVPSTSSLLFDEADLRRRSQPHCPPAFSGLRSFSIQTSSSSGSFVGDNFARGLERDGAHVAVYHRSQLKVNMWAGYADTESNRKWTPDTRTVLFSATKAISALCVAVLVDRGFVSYDDLVIKHWPAYGANGKATTTVEDILSHQAGLPYLEEPILIEHAKNATQILQMIEMAKPLWEPGTASGYHAITFGWIIDGLVRKVDPFGRDLRTFFREEISEPHGLDMDIGVQRDQLHRMARMTQPGLLEYARDIIKDPRMLAMLALMYVRPSDSPAWKVRDNTEWLPLTYDTVPFNDPEILELSIGSASGVGNAKHFAKLFSMALDGTLISNHTLREIATPSLDTWHWEKVVIWPVAKGHGFFYDAHPTLYGKHTFGHPGYGCQSIMVDPENDLVVSYVSNGLKTATSDLCQPYQRILSNVYQSL